MLRQLASRAASAQLCSALGVSSSSVAFASTRTVAATELSSRGLRSWASNDCDGPRSSSSSLSGRSSSFSAFDHSFAPATSYGSTSAWSSLGAQARKRAFSTTENDSPAAGLNPLLRAPGPLPASSASSAGAADVVPLASSSSSTTPQTLTAAQRQLRSRAVLKNIRISPKKLARFAKLVSGMHVEDALAQCSVARETKAAALLRGVIASAAANARTNHGNLRGGGSDSDNANFRVAEAVVGRAPTPTRPWYHGKGRTGVRHLYRSHLTIELEATSKPSLTRYQKPLLERQGKGRPPPPPRRREEKRRNEEVAEAA